MSLGVEEERVRDAMKVRQAPRWLWPLTIFAVLFLIATQYVGFRTVADRDMGNLVKIMFVHVPTALNAFMAVLIMFVASILYLWKRRETQDLIGASAAEVGAVLMGLTLVQGMIWGKPTWGVWWTWDARLTSSAVELVILVGYLALRSFTEDPGRRARWSAAVAVLGALNTVIVYWSVQWWRTLHQPLSSPMTVDPQYATALRLNLLSFLVATVALIGWRYRAARLEEAAQTLREHNTLVTGEGHAAGI